MSLVRWKDNDRYNPWRSIRSLQEEINSLFDMDRYPSNTGLFDREVRPALDVIENEQDFTIRCELPGIELKDLDVSFSANVLTVKGEKKEEKELDQEMYYRKETWSGSFQRTIPLPASVNTEKVNAISKDGYLTIIVPKREEAKPKRISISDK